jgi:leucyl aminopeptidase (aminopeptidase T)
MFGKFEFDLQRGGYVLVNDMLKIKPGETVVITADTASDMSVVSAAAGAVAAAEAKPLVMITPTPRGVGKATDPYLPVEALSGAVAAADVWVEFNGGWLLYSTVFENAMKNKKLRYLNLCEMDARMMYRCIAPVNQPVLAEFMSHLRKIFEGEHEVRVTNAAGTVLTFRTDPRNTISTDDGNSTNIGMNFLAGQFTIVPKFGSIEGALVFSGSLIPACGVLKEPVKLKVEHGRVTEISGGTQADEFRGWLAGFDDPNMYLLAHLSFGLNPGAGIRASVSRMNGYGATPNGG